MFVLKRTVGVSPDPATPDAASGRPFLLAKGVPLDTIPAYELAQLAPDHFVDVDGDGNPTDAVPDDWRTDPATLAHDQRQAANVAAEAEDRAQRKAARNALS